MERVAMDRERAGDERSGGDQQTTESNDTHCAAC